MSLVHLTAAALAMMAPLPVAAPAPAAFVEASLAAAPLQGRGQGKEKPQEARGQGQGQGQQRESQARGQGQRQNGGGGSEQPRARGQGSREGSAARGGGQGQTGRQESQARGQSGEKRDDARGGSQARGQGQRSETGGQGQGSAARGRSDDRGQGRQREEARTARTPADASGRSVSAPGSGRGRLVRNDVRERVRALPPELRRLSESSRPHERMVAGAVARGTAYGLAAGALTVRADDGRVRVLNRRNELLFDVDERRGRDLGGWELRRLGDRRPTGNAPAFCRSGEGHPVWGREWCLDKGFGLGSRTGLLWSRASIDDVIYRRRPDGGILDRGTLIGVLGDIVFGRLALHSLSLGYDQPLAGVWVAEPDAPRILRVQAGDVAVAELVDLDRDDRVEVLYISQPAVW